MTDEATKGTPAPAPTQPARPQVAWRTERAPVLPGGLLRSLSHGFLKLFSRRVYATVLLDNWQLLIDWIYDDLVKTGCEGGVLAPLGTLSPAATYLARASSLEDYYRHRKLGAALAGYVVQPSPTLLDSLLEEERARDADLDRDDEERLETQAVVEDIVFAASRWSRQEKLREAGCELLKKVVELSVNGEYWSSSGYAMATLCLHAHPKRGALLEAFTLYADGRAPRHPIQPNLRQERAIAHGLKAGDSQTLACVEGMLQRRDKAARAVEFVHQAKVSVEALLTAAYDFSRAYPTG